MESGRILARAFASPCGERRRCILRSYTLNTSPDIKDLFKGLISPLRWFLSGEKMVSVKRLCALVVAGELMFVGGGFAQRGGGSIGGGGAVPGINTPAGVDEKDALQGFHRAMALQATAEQTVEFSALVRKTETASSRLDELERRLQASSTSAGNPADLGARVDSVRQAIDAARTENSKFLGELTPAQKTGLKELTAKLMKAEVELGEQEKALEPSGDVRELAAHIDGLRKALANFRAEQDSLSVEMGVVISGQADEAAFVIPGRKSSITIGGESVGVITSAVVRRPGVSDGDTYKVDVTTDLAELQENIGTILAATSNKDDRCGERIRVQEATITPELPSVTAMIRIHYERWVCSPGYGGTREMTEGNAAVTMKLVAAIGGDGRVQISAEDVEVEADQFLVDLLKSGALGQELREKIAATVATAIADVKTSLPPVGNAAIARSVRFESLREGELSAVVSGQLQMSPEQAKIFGEQLKERATAHKQ